MGTKSLSKLLNALRKDRSPCQMPHSQIKRYANSLNWSADFAKWKRQSLLSTISLLTNHSLHKNLVHRGYLGTAASNLCPQASPFFPFPAPTWPPLSLRPAFRFPQPRSLFTGYIFLKKVHKKYVW